MPRGDPVRQTGAGRGERRMRVAAPHFSAELVRTLFPEPAGRGIVIVPRLDLANGQEKISDRRRLLGSTEAPATA